MTTVFLGLGSNVGERVDNINRAVKMLGESGQIRVTAVSSLYETEAMGTSQQADFYNCAVRVETDLDPHALLAKVKGIELKLGRRPGTHLMPRPIDIDILLYDDTDLESIDLKIPHPRLRTRRFVLEPLLELDPNLTDPVSSRPLKEFLPDVIDQRVRKLGAE
jgi:2-amino-4-hydroxy-6-hydroxymethyldihydropteridine diphosphokinase